MRAVRADVFMRYLGTLMVGVLVFSARANSLSGYLPAVGPSPLRFQSPPARVIAIALPPLQMGTEEPPAPPVPVDIAPVEIAVTPLAPAVAQPATSNAIAPTPTPTATNVVTAIAANRAPTVIVPETEAAPVVSPQMLLQFFQTKAASSTNREVSVMTPLGFNPARPAPTPSSTAAYISTKP